MLKTIFIIIVSVTASALTTAGLLYRYTVPVQPAVSFVQPQQMDYTDPRPAPAEILDEYVNLQTDLPTVTTQPAIAAAPTPKPVVTVPRPEQSTRAFDHNLLMSDISGLSKKLERFNDFLSNEVQRLRSGDEEKTKP